MGAPPPVHQNASITNFFTKSYTQLLHPPNMPKSSNFSEDRMAKAFEAAMRQKKPNISKIAREFDVSHETLISRIKSAKSPTSTGASR
jgi:transcriptional regulator with PAS, ATPase and Fis domain